MTNKKILTLISFLLLFSFLMVGCIPKLNQPPEITSAPVITATVGVAYTYKVVATDSNAGDVLTYSLTTEPPGMLINGTSGVITWTPDTAGDFPVTVEASDGKLSDTQSFTITVNEPEPEPEIELTGIVVDPKTMTLFAGGSETIKSVTATYEIRETEVPIALGDCTFESDDDEVTTVSDVGVVTAVAEGTATITVSYGGETDTVEVTVSEFVLELVGIEVDPEEMTVCIPLVKGLNTGTFRVIATYNDTTIADVTSACAYGISDISIAEVGAGIVTALKVGTATISISYTEGGITKGTILPVIVEGTIKIRWLEDSVRFRPDNSIWYTFQNDLIPPSTSDPATLILTGGEYHFADANEFYNYPGLTDFEGSVVIDGTGQLSGDTTYTSTASGLPIKEHIEGDVKIIIYDGVVADADVTMVGTYTQWAYASGTEGEVLEGEGIANFDGYLKAVLAPEIGLDWWFIGYTEYIAHGGK